MQYRSRTARVRSAYTLIELIVVISILLVLMSLISGVVMRVWGSSRDRLEKQHWRSMHEMGKPAERTRPIRVLFIGNSYTFVNDLPGLTVALADASGQSPRLEIDSQLVGGATLEQHWNDGVAVQKIRQGNWDFVVLQEQSMRPIIDSKKMNEYARLFNDEIRKVDAIPLYYLTWARKAFPDTQKNLTLSYMKIAQETKAEVAGVGIAWDRSLRRNPTLVLHDADGSHPNPTGSYLAACVFYAAIFNRSPEGLPPQLSVNGSMIVNLNPNDAQQLQTIAWQAWKETREKVRPDLHVH